MIGDIALRIACDHITDELCGGPLDDRASTIALAADAVTACAAHGYVLLGNRVGMATLRQIVVSRLCSCGWLYSDADELTRAVWDDLRACLAKRSGLTTAREG